MTLSERLLDELAALRGETGDLVKSPATAAEKINKNSKLRSQIQKLYRAFTGTNLTGCSSCSDRYADALYHLHSMDEKKVKVANYEMVRGKILRHPSGDIKRAATAVNLTDELAETHLALNPDNIRFFTRVPSDWEERVEARRKEMAGVKFVDKKVSEDVADEKAKSIIDEAEQKAKSIIDEAEQKAKSIIDEAEQKTKPIVDEAEAEVSNGFDFDELNEVPEVEVPEKPKRGRKPASK